MTLARVHAEIDPDLPSARYRLRFWSKMRTVPRTGCWEWTASRAPLGYGRVGWIGTQTRQAHRVAYALAFGDPGDSMVCHHCDNPPCCNPSHLFAGTRADNMADMHAKGRRNYRGHVSGNRRLTPGDITAIRALLAEGQSHKGIGAQFGVSGTQIYRIAHGLQWAHT